MSKERIVGGVIIMHPTGVNYGTYLQGYATIKSVQSLGYKIRIIRYIKKRTIGEILLCLPGLLRTGILRQLLNSRKEQKRNNNPEYKMIKSSRLKSIKDFRDSYYEPISDFYTGYEELQKGSRNYDIIFVGSDQVWGPFSLYGRFYNLLFVDRSIPKFSYASSFGVSDILPWQKKETSLYLNAMDAIGVREPRAKEIVDDLSNKKATVVLDPTMLLTRDQWDNEILKSKIEVEEPYILAYILGFRQDVRDSIVTFAKEMGLKILSFRHMERYKYEDVDFGDIVDISSGPLDFVKLIKGAKYICTDSFHCSVFSTIYHKQFLTFYRVAPSKKGSTHSRIDGLLGMLGLSDRIVNNNANIKDQMLENIDFERVDLRLSELRNASLSFLENSLKINRI